MSSLKRKVFFCNLVIAALCLASIISYFILPFWKIDVSYTLNTDAIDKIASTLDLGEGGEESGEEPADEFLSSVIDALADEVEKSPYALTLSISLKTQDILSAEESDPKVVVEGILQKNIDDLMAQIDTFLDRFVPIVLKAATKSTLTNELVNQMKNQLAEGATTEEAKAELESMGIDEEYIDNKTSQLIDAIYEENATPETVADNTITIVEDVLTTLRESGNEDYTDAELSEEDKEELKNSLIEVFEQFAGEDGTLNPDRFTTELFLTLLNGNPGEEGGEEPEKAPEESASANNNAFVKKVYLSSAPETESNPEDVEAELRALILDSLMEALEGSVEVIATVFSYLSKVIWFIFFVWAYPIVKILLKLGMKNNSVKVKLPIWLGSFPFLILHLAPNTALSLVMESAAATNPLLGALSMKFFSCSIVSFYAGWALVLFTLFYYGRLRRKLRRAIKQEKSFVYAPAAATATATTGNPYLNEQIKKNEEKKDAAAEVKKETATTTTDTNQEEKK